MPSDDELRRVAEDVRALARSLGRDFRSAVDRARDDTHGPGGSGGASGEYRPRGRRSAREDLAAAGREARQEFRAARNAIRHVRHHGPEGHEDLEDGVDQAEEGGGWPTPTPTSTATSTWERPAAGPGPGCPPRWDNWGGSRGYAHARTQPRDRTSTGSGGPAGSARSRGRSGPGRQTWQPPNPAGARDQAPVVAPIPAPPLRHRHDGSTLLGLMAVVFGLAGLVAATHLAHVRTEAVVAIALMVLGGAMVVTARTDWALSRRSWPILGGAVLAVALVTISAAPGFPVWAQNVQFGSRTLAPTSWATVPAVVHGGIGRNIVDLTEAGSLTTDQTLSIDNAAGRLEIYLPPDLPVHLHAQVTAGQVEVNGVATSGVHRSFDQTLGPSTTGPALTLNVVTGFGSVFISNVAAPPSIRVSPNPTIGIVPTPPTVPPTPSLNSPTTVGEKGATP